MDFIETLDMLSEEAPAEYRRAAAETGGMTVPGFMAVAARAQARIDAIDVYKRQLPDNAPMFVEDVKCLLAAQMATTVTGKPQNVGVFLDLYRRYIADALHHDVSQRGSNDQHPLMDILNRSIL